MYCIGCGVKLQAENQAKVGFVPRSALQNKDEILCRRCFRLKHYNETEDVGYTEDDFHFMISNIRKKRGIVVHIIDLFDVDGSLITGLQRFIGNKKVLLVGNKVDLLPKSTNRRKLEHWLRTLANKAGIKIDDVCLISATKAHGLDELKEKMETLRKGQDVYVVGTTNVGKSTLINRLIQDSTGIKNVITTSYFPGTTLGFIEIPLDHDTFLIDTPGIINPQQIVHYVSDQDVKVILPEREIKPRVYQLESEQTLFFGGLIRLDIIRGNKQPYICYVANELPIHRTKLNNADSLFKRQRGKLLSPPDKETIASMPEMTKNTFKITQGEMDVVFPGLGWVTINEGDVTLTVHYPKEVIVSIRKSFIQRGR